MKKRLFLLTILCLSILGIIGCSKDKENIDTTTEITHTETDVTATNADATTTVTTEETTVTTITETTEVTTEVATTEETDDNETDNTTTIEYVPTPVTTEETTTEQPAHTHNWVPIYATREIQMYADDGTTNDYSKPIYEEVDNGHYEPIYELHDWSGSLDVTVWCQTTGWYPSDTYTNREAAESWLANGGHPGRHIYTKEVQVGEEWVPNIEKVLVGYEQLGTTTEQYIDHYECTCGATK